ncbi:MAG: YbaB/EbfC family nucleoid-associated protein [Pseudomonadota bacterium]
MSDDTPPNLNDLLQSAQKMQEQLGRVQAQLAKKTVEGSAGGGMVVVVVNGRQQLVSVRIDRQIVDPEDIEMLQDLVVAATNQALSKATELAQQEFAQVSGGFAIKIPGLT